MPTRCWSRFGEGFIHFCSGWRLHAQYLPILKGEVRRKTFFENVSGYVCAVEVAKMFKAKLLEAAMPKIKQMFIELDADGSPRGVALLFFFSSV